MNVFELFAKLSLDSSEYDQALDRAKAGAQTLNKGLETAAKVGATAVAAAGGAVVAFGASAVKAGSQFDSSMSQVAATMGTTVDNIQNLRDFAMEMGSSTAFSASQAADALNYMALAGYDADKSMSMLPSVLNLAAAGGIELAYASDMVTDASSALGLSEKETAAMIDQMAKASSKSNTSVSQLGEAMLTIGATARSVKGGTVELSTLLGVLADNGIKGSEGGTKLRNMIMSLQNPTKDGAAALEQLGVEIYDSTGNMRSMIDILADFQGGMADLDQASKDSLINDIFNKQDAAAVNALIGTTTQHFKALSIEIQNSGGAAEAMAETQLDNLTGDMTLFKSALEGAQIALSDALTPALREVVEQGTNGLGKLTEKFQSAEFAEKMGEIGEKLGVIAEKVVDFLINLDWDSVLDGIVSAISAIAEVLMFVIDHLDVIVPIVKVLIGLLIALKAIQLAVTIAQTAMNLVFLVNPIGFLIGLIAALVAAFVYLWNNSEDFRNFWIGMWDNIKNVFSNVVDFFRKVFTEDIPNMISSAIDFLKGLPGKALEWGKDLLDNFTNGIKSKIDSLKDTLRGAADKVKDFLGFSEPDEGPLSNFHTFAPDMMDLFAQGIRDNESVITDAISDTFAIGGAIQRVATADTRSGGANLAGAGIGGDIVIPIYWDGALMTEAIVKADQINDYVTGGRG